jgi:hypothetical protein
MQSERRNEPALDDDDAGHGAHSDVETAYVATGQGVQSDDPVEMV